MDKFLIKRKKIGDGETSFGVGNSSSASAPSQQSVPAMAYSSKEFVDLNSLPSDPAFRKRIYEYHPNQVDDIRIYYIQKGPCQPTGHVFPQKMIGTKMRRFNPMWFDDYHDWLEYSIAADRVYCLCCYLFRDQSCDQRFGACAFTSEGFSSWHKNDRLDLHVGEVNSGHFICQKKCDDLKRQNQSIEVAFHRQDDNVKNDNRIRLCAAIATCRLLLNQGHAFRGHDESEKSLNQGTFLETLKALSLQNESIRNVVLKKNNQMKSPIIQKDIVRCFAEEIEQKIIEEFKDDYFAILVDESSDVSKKEQMAVVLRFVDSCGNVKERFIRVVHVLETSASSLKSAIDGVLANFNLSLMKVRGQGYDGASNMRGEFNGLKTLIMRENPSAYYVHCFAHQLQLALVALAKNYDDIEDFFSMISTITNVVGASCKRKYMLRIRQAAKVTEEIDSGLIETGRGLNQELGLARAADTRWGSHFKSLLNLSAIFSSVAEVLEAVSLDAAESSKRNQARGLLGYLQSFDFVFNLQLMLTILSITNELSQALQRKDTDILNAMSLVNLSKDRLQMTRSDGWDSLLKKVVDFCNKNNIGCSDMDAEYVNRHRPRHKTHVTNDFHYRVECFYAILDRQILEINDRFNEINSELLICVASLNPSDRFVDFDSSKLIRLAQFYPDDFTCHECRALEYQLDTYIMDMRSDSRFGQLKGIADLCSLLVTTRKYLSYPLVYRLLKLALILPVATASVERCFSEMNYVKNELQNKICDQFLNDCLLCFIEKDLLREVKEEDVIKRFQGMKTRKGQI